MQTFKHGEHVITLDDMGVFHAEHGGTKIEAGSLAGIKKKLDKAPEFEAFDALDCRDYGVNPVRVVGRTKPRSGSWRRREWKLADGDERSFVYADTPENRALLERQKVMHERHIAERKRIEDESRAMAAQIARLHPDPLT